MIESFKVDKLEVRLFAGRAACGQAAAKFVGDHMRRIMAERGRCALSFAAAPSQLEFLDALAGDPDIDWSRVTGYQIDEYLDIDADDPRRLVNFMERHFYVKARPGDIRFMPTRTDDAEAEAAKYADLLRQTPPDICCQGIGQSGHIAYNDPHLADFNDPLDVKVVHIDATSRQQQVTDGTVQRVQDAIGRAYTMTIPMLLRAPVQSIVCPGKVKAPSVRRTLTEPIGEAWPATALRTHDNAVMFIDADSAGELER